MMRRICPECGGTPPNAHRPECRLEAIRVLREVRDHIRYHVQGVKAMWYGADQRASHLRMLDRVSGGSGFHDDGHNCRCAIYRPGEVGAG